MSFKIAPANRKGFFTILICDALALLAAIYYHTRQPGKRGTASVVRRTRKTAWGFFGFMGLVTILYAVASREREDSGEDDTIRGLPPDRQ